MKRKVLFFADGLYGGGAEKVLQTLLHYLNRDKFDITLYSIKQEELNEKYPKDIDYHYVFASCTSSDSLWKKLWIRCLNKIKLLVYYCLSPKWFYRLFIKGKYDTEVAFIEGYATRIVSGSTNPKSKKIAWVHTDLEKNHWTSVAFQTSKEEIKTYRCYDKIICVSKSVENVIKRMFPLCKEYAYIYNPVDIKTIRDLAGKKNIEGKNSQKIITFVTCGRLVPQKGYTRLLKVILDLKKEGYEHNLKLIIIGDGPEKKIIESYIYQNNLSDNIELTGYADNPYFIMKKADCFICSSVAEGFSLVILEAMILGLPIISTNCSGPNEILGNSEYGLLVDNSEEGLYDGIKKILTDESVINIYKEKSLIRCNDFNLYNTIHKIEEVL